MSTGIVVSEIENDKKRKVHSTEWEDSISTLKRQCTTEISGDDEEQMVVPSSDEEQMVVPSSTCKKKPGEATLDEWHEALALSFGFPRDIAKSMQRPKYERPVAIDPRHNYAEEFNRMLKLLYRRGKGSEKKDFPTVPGETYTFRGYTSTSYVPEWVLQMVSSTSHISAVEQLSPRYVVEFRLPVGMRCTVIPSSEYEIILPHDCKARLVNKLDLPLEIKNKDEDTAQIVIIPYFIFEVIDDGIRIEEEKS